MEKTTLSGLVSLSVGLFLAGFCACRTTVGAPAEGRAEGERERQSQPEAAEREKTAAPAQDALSALLDRVEAERRKVKVLKADATYNRLAALLEMDETFTGSLLFNKPRLLRMELTRKDGKRKRIYVVGRKYAWLYYPTKKLAERYRMEPTDRKDPLELDRAPNPFEYGLTHGIQELRKGFHMRISGAEKINGRRATIVEVVPRQPRPEAPGREQKENVKYMFWIDDEKALPVRVREFKSKGQIVETFTLSDVKVNPIRLLPRFGDPFEFEPPDDTYVVKYGEKEEKGEE